MLFQSTPPRRRRLSVRVGKDVVSDISIHASAKEATSPLPSIALPLTFQSTPPRRRRPEYSEKCRVITIFQSTPPRRRRRQDRTGTADRQYFNPRLREGGDAVHRPHSCLTLTFQSTPPRRRRPKIPLYHNHNKEFQSTPPRRRRLMWLFTKSYTFHFNPRLREGGDCSSLGVIQSAHQFQSTPPRRRRRVILS